ncbi:chemotaxis protein CheW [Shewanella alkalitolerans]|uniref:chemotaxis protein CheW n=1 Tax=Shewanella alkalitolerans TaxID=2864209 RepID=UPI001C65636D|nr:chemotaxis protein CheW [Shewanella alkalitolerans]QYJ98937.1 chemotaxis protein CheW [Shewanella alkalitolerans]
MSNSVDEAVFNYFSLLLSEPGEESVAADKPEVKREQVTAQNGQMSVSAPAVKRLPVGEQSKPRPVITQATPTPLNKLALEQLLAPVSELDVQTETNTETQIASKVEIKTLDTKPASVETMTQAVSVQTKSESQVKQKIEEKLETSASIKQEQVVSDKVDLAAAPQTQIGATPPGVTEELVELLDEEFQVLFFKVAGLTLAVPLVSLGGIVKVERINHIMGRPAWYLGVQTHRDSQLNIVDSGAWVMPEKYDDKLAQSVDYQYIVLLEDSNWGLACESLVNSVRILKSEVNWRTKAGKRPWLAGVVKEQMCGILHVQALIELLNLGLGSQDSIG